MSKKECIEKLERELERMDINYMEYLEIYKRENGEDAKNAHNMMIYLRNKIGLYIDCAWDLGIIKLEKKREYEKKIS